MLRQAPPEFEFYLPIQRILSFVRELLQRCGFRNVRVIAESAAYHREVQRLLFIAEPAQASRQDVRESLQVVA